MVSGHLPPRIPQSWSFICDGRKWSSGRMFRKLLKVKGMDHRAYLGLQDDGSTGRLVLVTCLTFQYLFVETPIKKKKNLKQKYDFVVVVDMDIVESRNKCLKFCKQKSEANVTNGSEKKIETFRFYWGYAHDVTAKRWVAALALILSKLNNSVKKWEVVRLMY